MPNRRQLRKDRTAQLEVVGIDPSRLSLEVSRESSSLSLAPLDLELGPQAGDSARLQWTKGPGGPRIVSGYPPPKHPAGEPLFEVRELDDQCLGRFLDLAEAADKGILKFAQRYGVLGICQHGIPASHGTRCGSLYSYEDESLAPTFWEPLEAWRRYAAQADAILRVAADLRAGRTSPQALWEPIIAGAPRELPPVYSQHDVPKVPDDSLMHLSDIVPSDMFDARLAIRLAAMDWLSLGGVFLSASSDEGESSLSFHLASLGLFGFLSVQLGAALSSDLGVYFCMDCGRPYEPPGGRRPKRGQKNYCPACRLSGHKHSKRVYERRRNNRDRAKNLAEAEGSISE